MDILAMAAALLILLTLTLKKVPIVISALLSAAFMAACSGLPAFQTIADNYLEGLAGFAKSAWLMFLLGVILSRLMEHTGAAASIAHFIVRRVGVRWAIPAVIISGSFLTYGGISGIAACYALYPIALVVFREADLPKYLMPAAISAGVHTWATMLPGNSAVLNILPVAYLNTTAMAAPGIGIFGAAFALMLTLMYFAYAVKRAAKRGERFETDESGEKALKKLDALETEKGLPNFFLSLLPVFCVAVLMNAFKRDVSEALAAGILLCCLLFGKNIRHGQEILENAAKEASATLMTAASAVGIGHVMRAMPGFQKIVELVLGGGESDGNPLVIFVAAVALMSGLNASAMSGLSTILSALAKPFLQMGISADLLHRMGVIAAVGPGGLPHSSGMVTVLEISGVSYREGYWHLFAVVVVIPLITLLAVLACTTNIF